MSRDEYRALTPWSFFLPVSLAVMLGVLVANALGAALFDHDDAPAGPAAAAAVEAGEPADAADALALAICHVWRGGAALRIDAAVAAQRSR